MVYVNVKWKFLLCCSFIIPPNKKLLSIYYTAPALRGISQWAKGIILTLRERTVRWSKDIQHSVNRLHWEVREGFAEETQLNSRLNDEWRACCGEVMGVMLEKLGLLMCFSCWVFFKSSLCVLILICWRNILKQKVSPFLLYHCSIHSTWH